MSRKMNRWKVLIGLFIVFAGLVWTFAVVFCPLWPIKPKFATKQSLALSPLTRNVMVKTGITTSLSLPIYRSSRRTIIK